MNNHTDNQLSETARNPETVERSGLAGMAGSGELEPAMQEYEHAIYAMRKARKRAGKLIAKDRRFHRIKSGKVAQLSGIPLSIIEKIEMGSGGNADDMWRVIKAIAVLKTHKGMTKENIFPNGEVRHSAGKTECDKK